jgi:hypothetical protein
MSLRHAGSAMPGPAAQVAGTGVSNARRVSDALGTSTARPRWQDMPKYFFNLAGDLPAHDLIGHDCASEREAREHASFIAHRIGTEKPGMVREGNFISVVDAGGREIHKAPLASTTA